jgi:hypothetical protein
VEKIYIRSGAVFALLSMAYLVAILVTNKLPINLASFGLWFILDVAIVAAMLVARKEVGGPLPWLMIAFTVGTGCIVLISGVNMLRGESALRWGVVENWTIVAVIAAMIIWRLTSAKWGVVMSSNAMLIATIPTWADAWNMPASQDLIFWILSCTGCALTIFGSPKNFFARYMPVVGTLSNAAIIIMALRQFA